MGSSTVAMTAQVYVGLAADEPQDPLSPPRRDVHRRCALTGRLSAVTNQAPAMTQPANQTSAEGANVSLQLTASDPDGNGIDLQRHRSPRLAERQRHDRVDLGHADIHERWLLQRSPRRRPTGPSRTARRSPGRFPTSASRRASRVCRRLQAPIGASVTISGANFGSTQGTSSVRFNGTDRDADDVGAPTASWSPVPSGATTGCGGRDSERRRQQRRHLHRHHGARTCRRPGRRRMSATRRVAGQATYASGIFSVSGAGADIWNNSDQFHFVYQTLTGDGGDRGPRRQPAEHGSPGRKRPS